MLSASLLVPLAIFASAPAALAQAELFDPVKLNAPTPPSTPLGSVSWNLPGSTDEVAKSGLPLGRKVDGSFLGFSIELSVVDQLLDKEYFVNHLRNIQERVGRGPKVRVGGNSAEASTFYPNGLTGADASKLIGKDTSRTKTPLIHFDNKLFDAMKSITDKVSTEWFLGLSFADPTDLSNTELVMAAAQNTLGDSLSAFQFGNEPDLYNGSAARRIGKYPLETYESELDAALKQLGRTDGSAQTKLQLPTVCCQWSPSDILQSGMIDKYAPVMEALSFAHYPQNDCFNGGKTPQAIQAMFPTYLTHDSVIEYVTPYIASADKATELGLGVHMLEYNTASCSGFQGLSTSFGAAIWATDLALSMASRKFTMALLHVGGRSAWYNPFTAPSGGKANKDKKFTTGSVYYSTLVVAEALGNSSDSQVVDLTGSNNPLAPAYAIYENGAPTRAVLFNYVSDPTSSTANTYEAVLSNVQSSTVHVRYLRADSVAEQESITWASQTLGRSYASTGNLLGDVETISITCNDGKCSIPVYAPSVAVVYLTRAALDQSTPAERMYSVNPVAGGAVSSHASTATKTKATGTAKASASASTRVNSADVTSGAERGMKVGASMVAVAAAAVVVGGGALARFF